MASTQSDLNEKHKTSARYIEQASTESGLSPKEGEDAATPDWTSEEERKIVWKIDFRVFPMLCVLFGLSPLNRSNISAAFIANMDEDLNLVGNRYNIALLVFFIGYGLSELPSNYVIRRVGARWSLSFLIVSWGACASDMERGLRW